MNVTISHHRHRSDDRTSEGQRHRSCLMGDVRCDQLASRTTVSWSDPWLMRMFHY
jgi:hypothetical protein